MALVSPLVPIARRIKREDGFKAALTVSEWEWRALGAEQALEAAKSKLSSTEAELSKLQHRLAEAEEALVECRAKRSEQQDSVWTSGEQQALVQIQMAANDDIVAGGHLISGSRSEGPELCSSAPQSVAEVNKCSQVLAGKASVAERNQAATFLAQAAHLNNLTSAAAAAAAKAGLKDSDGGIRTVCGTLLGSIAGAAPGLMDAATVTLLLGRLQNDTVWGARSSAAVGLRWLFDFRPDLAGPEAARVLQKAMEDQEEAVAERSGRALGALAVGRPELAAAVVRGLFQGLTWATSSQNGFLWLKAGKLVARPQTAALGAIFVERLGKVSEDLVATLVGAATEFYQYKVGHLAEPRRELARFTAQFFVTPRAHSFSNLKSNYTLWLTEALKTEEDADAELNLVQACRTLGSAVATLAPRLRTLLNKTAALAETKRLAVMTLQEIGNTNPKTRTALGNLLDDRSAEPDVKVAACNYLWSLQEAAEPLAEVLGRALDAGLNPTPRVRAAAARALGAAGVAAAMVLPILVVALYDDSWEVRLEVAKILARFGQELTEAGAKEAARQLTRIMTGAVQEANPPALRVAAILAIGSLGEYADFVLMDLERTLLTSGLLDERKAAEVALGRLSAGSPAAMSVWKGLLNTWGRAYSLFEAVIRSKASDAAEEWQDFSRRSRHTETFFAATSGCSACWPAAGRGLDSRALLAADAFTIVTNRSGQDSKASCAALCARATPFVIDEAGRSPKDMANFRGLFLKPNHSDWEGVLRIDARRLAGYCVAFTVLNVSDSKVSCLLFQTMPEGTIKTAAPGYTPIYSVQAPKSASFCARAWQYRNQSNVSLVATCKNTLAPQFSGSGSATRPGSMATVNAICQEECEALVQRVQAIAQMPDYSPERRDFALSEGSLENLTDTGKEVALADACTRDVVQLVEHHHISCCATACAWSYRTRSCHGNVTLFPKDALERWREECCTAMGIIRGSDRERMCTWALTPSAANVTDAELTPRGDSEAAEMGQDVAVSINASAPSARASGSLLEVSGSLLGVAAAHLGEPTVSEQDYAQAVAQGVDSLKAFISRAVESLGAVVADQAGLSQTALRYSSVLKQNFTQLMDELRSVSQTEGGWVRKEEAAAPCRLLCKEQSFFAMTLGQCSDKAKQEWFATKSAPNMLCSVHDVETVTDSPHLCAEAARNRTQDASRNRTQAAVQAARWQFIPTSFIQRGRPSGTCRLYSNCQRLLAGMWKDARDVMNGTSEALWLRLQSAR